MKRFEDLKVGERLWILFSGRLKYDWEEVLEIGEGRPKRSHVMVDTRNAERNLPRKRSVTCGIPNGAYLFASKEGLCKAWRKDIKTMERNLKKLEQTEDV